MRKMKRWGNLCDVVLSIFFTYNDMPLVYIMCLREKTQLRREAEGSAMVQCCRGTLLMTSRIQHQHDANHLT